MPEQVRSLWLAAAQSGPVDGIGVTVEDRAQDPRKVTGVILAVGVVDDDHVATRGVDRGPDGGALAPIGRVGDDAQAGDLAALL